MEPHGAHQRNGQKRGGAKKECVFMNEVLEARQGLPNGIDIGGSMWNVCVGGGGRGGRGG